MEWELTTEYTEYTEEELGAAEPQRRQFHSVDRAIQAISEGQTLLVGFKVCE